ncbi:MAG: selenocysteine-specific translation elongation factor [Pyrinomonadaceae bacterium]
MNVIVGTAGHIDHGKTSLVKALTGTDADRLPEEKLRGITVDLGFAEMTVGDVHLGFVDVPGHERFVKNMLAGAGGIDVVMLIIAADEGVMPQTREHFDICRLLGLNAGIVVLTKTDLVDAETLELAKLDAFELVAGSFLADAPVIEVSSRTLAGIDELRDELCRLRSSLPARNDRFVTRLPVDRSFSVKGFGAVVTGTLASGTIVEGAEMELLPAGTKVRVRGLQTHGRSVKSVSAGQRVAVNLGGIDHSKVERGMIISEPGVLRSTQIVDSEIEVLAGASKPLRSRQRVRVHLGTVEALARIQVLNDTGEITPGTKDLAQIRFEMPVISIPGERFIIRSYSPQTTIAGGRVIENAAIKHRKKDIPSVRDHLFELVRAANEAADLKVRLEAAGSSGLNYADLRSVTALRNELLRSAIDTATVSGEIVEADRHFVTTSTFKAISARAENAISEFHKREPLAKGISREALREKVFARVPPEIFQTVVASLESAGRIVLDKEVIRLAAYQTILSPQAAALSEKIIQEYRAAKLEVPKLDDFLAASISGTGFTVQDARKFFQLFLDSGEIVKVTDDFYFAKTSIDELSELIRQFAAKTTDRLIDVAKFKELAGISRKYAIPLLEYYDRERITRRAGDKRLIL